MSDASWVGRCQMAVEDNIETRPRARRRQQSMLKLAHRELSTCVESQFTTRSGAATSHTSTPP